MISLLAFAVHPLHDHVVVIINDNVDDFIFGFLPLHHHISGIFAGPPLSESIIGVYQGFFSVSFSGGVTERALIEVTLCYCSSSVSSYTGILLEHSNHTSLCRRTASDFQKHEEREY